MAMSTEMKNKKTKGVITKNCVVLTLPLSTPTSSPLLAAIKLAYETAFPLATDASWSQVSGDLDYMRVSSVTNAIYLRDANTNADTTLTGIILPPDTVNELPGFAGEDEVEPLKYQCVSEIYVWCFFNARIRNVNAGTP